MLWTDLRTYLDALEQRGELRAVRGADWQEEIGAITELMVETKGPALLFDEIPGYPQGFRVVSNVYTNPRRTALAVGLDPEEPEPHRRWHEKMRALKPEPMEEVATGPVLENVLTGDAVDLYRFPVPKWHEQDGGRYIGTGVCVINQDPETGCVNSGAYRVALVDKRTCTVFMEAGKHGYRIAQTYWAAGKKCPVVISVGQEPVLGALAGSSLYHTPKGVSELEVAGYLHGEPYPVVRGRVTGLPFPASAEIVLEGFIPSPDERLHPEGPFGEWTGYYAHERRPELVIEVEAVYHRNNPIIFGCPPARPVGVYVNPNLGDDDLESLQALEAAGVEGVQRVSFLGRPFLRVVSLRQLYAGHVEEVMRVLEPGGDQYSGHHVWIVVDDDIDVTSSAEVLWAVAGRLAPEHGVTLVPGTAVWQLDPLIPPKGRSGPGTHGRERYRADNLILNACRPYEWKDQFPPVAVNGAELRQRTREKWAELFRD